MKITMTGNGLKVLASLSYTRDNEGQIKGTTITGLPDENTSDTYDTNNRLEKYGSTTYAYDSANEPTTLGANTSVYDAAGELKTSGNTIYGYDQLGNRVSATPKGGQATIYGYDQAGNLTQVKGGVGGLNDTYAYDGNGLRASQTKGKTTTYITWDMHDELPLILSDEQNNYIYGPGNIPIEQIQSKGAVLYLHHDQQGSTRMITSTTGAVEGTTSYDAYGNTTGATGTVTTPLGYDAQYTNTDTDLIYLQARSYDPTTAQLTSNDPIAIISRAPYNYALDNPLTITDPTGLCGVFSCLEDAAEAGAHVVEGGVHFIEQNPTLDGLGLGATAVVTGGGALVVEGGAAGTLVLISAASGVGAALLDQSGCLNNNDTVACVGAGLGFAGLGLSGPEILATGNFIAETSTVQGLAGAGLGLGTGAFFLDYLHGLSETLKTAFECV